MTPSPDLWHGTTILTVRKGGVVAIGGDGQVTIGQTIVKANARKVRRLGKGDVIGGFAGATADAFTLFERLEAKRVQHVEQHRAILWDVVHHRRRCVARLAEQDPLQRRAGRDHPIVPQQCRAGE